MYTIKNYVTAESLEQAAALKEKGRNNVIIGGNLWLKMGRRSIQNAIDLSRLHLDGIEEDAEGFRIGCMVTLRELEVHEGLKGTFGNIFKEAVRHIVGVQFRNLATVGGSIFPRFGFSDVLTAFMSCDSYVELYRGGRIPIREFAEMPLDNDILTHIYIKKDGRKVRYQSYRITETDFPVLTCAVIRKENDFLLCSERVRRGRSASTGSRWRLRKRKRRENDLQRRWQSGQSLAATCAAAPPIGESLPEY